MQIIEFSSLNISPSSLPNLKTFFLNNQPPNHHQTTPSSSSSLSSTTKKRKNHVHTIPICPIPTKADAKITAADNDDGNNTNNHDANQSSPTKDKNDGDNGSQGRQTAVLVESDGYNIKNGHRVVIQHSRSPSTTSHRLADV